MGLIFSKLFKNKNYILKKNIEDDINEEINRLGNQHYIVNQLFGDIFKAPLTKNLEKGIKVLDIGCGNGIWCLEMAKTFPESKFYGYDKFDVYPLHNIFSNCFLRNKINDNIEFDINIIDTLKNIPDQSFDYIFQRFMAIVIENNKWTQILKEYKRILKPNGYIELLEHDINMKIIGDEKKIKNSKKFIGSINKLLQKRSINPNIVLELDEKLKVGGFKNIIINQEYCFLNSNNLGRICSYYVKESIYAFKDYFPDIDDIFKKLQEEHINNNVYLEYFNYIATK